MANDSQAIKQLADSIWDLNRRLTAYEMTGQLGNSSIENTSLNIYDADGVKTGEVGKLPDGSTGMRVVEGPTPAAPSGVTTEPGVGNFVAHWDGKFAGGAAAPMDLKHVALHASATPDFEPTSENVVTSFSAVEPTSRVVPLAGGTYFVKLTALSIPGKRSAATEEVEAISGALVDEDSIQEALDAERTAREQAALEAQAELALLDGKLVEARTDLDATAESVDSLRDVELPAVKAELEQADAEAAQALGVLDDKLAGLGDSELIGDLRASLADAQQAITAAQATADAAVTAANSANQAALQAAGIADAKGKVIFSETEPGAADQSPSNLWIKPSTEATHVWDGDSWEPITSDLLDQAAQNAIDAQNTANQAKQTAETAIANAATAQAAAQAAQATADQATTDARDAHNEAVAAQEKADRLLAAGENLLTVGGFESGTKEEIFSGRSGSAVHYERWEIIEDAAQAYEGKRFARYTGNGSIGGHVAFPSVPVTPGRTYRVSITARKTGPAAIGSVGWPMNWYTADGSLENNNYPTELWNKDLFVDQLTDQWQTFTADVVPAAGVAEFNPRFVANTSAPEGLVIDFDAMRVVDVTDALQAQAAAEDAQDRAEEAYAEAASKATPAEVSAAATAAENAAKAAASADATAKADQAKAQALSGAATDASSKAAAAQAAAVAAASADAAAKANQALSDALAALATARGEIDDQIIASANGKNSVTISTALPTSSTPGVVAGDIWWRRDGSSQIFGQWTWSGSAWVASTIRNEMIASLDVHKLQVTGDAKMASAVIDKLWVDGLVGKSATFNQISVAAGNLINDPNGLDPILRAGIGGPSWSWDNTGKYWKRPAVTGGTTQFNAYQNAGSGYDSNLLTAGAMYVIAYDVWVDKVGPNTGGRASIYYRRVDGTTAFVGDGTETGGDSDSADTITPGQWTRVERFWRAPDDASSGGINFQIIWNASDATEVRIRRPYIGRQASSVLIEDGAVNAQKVNAQSVAGAVGTFVEANVGKLVADSTTTKTAVIEKLWADGIAAKSITASKLTVASSNLIANGGGEYGDLTHWQFFAFSPGAPSQTGAANGFRSASGNFFDIAPGERMALQAGQKYVMDVWLDRSVAGIDTAIQIVWQNESGSTVNSEYPIWPKNSPVGLTYYSAEVIAPAGTVQGKVRVVPVHSNGAGGTTTFYNLRLRPAVGAVLIEDGAVNADKLAADSVTAGKIKAGEIETPHMKANSINADRLVANSITADQIDATSIGSELITAGTLRTGTTGQRVELDSGGLIAYGSGLRSVGLTPTGIKAYDANGAGSVSIDGQNNFLAGKISTAGDGYPGAILTPTTTGGSGLWFSQNGATTSDQAAIYSHLDGNIHIRPKDSLPKGTVFIDGNLVVGDKTTFNSTVDASAFFTTGSTTTGTLILNGNMSMPASGTAYLYGAVQVGGYLYNAGHATSSAQGSQNIYMNPTTGLMARVVSSRRYKQDIQDWSPSSEAVLALQPRKWRAKDLTEVDGPDDWGVGFIAEEVNDISGLEHLVQYIEDDEGRLIPESINYDRFAAAQQVVLKKHEQEIADLKAENEELKDRLAALEAKVAAL